MQYDDEKPFQITFWRPIKWERNLLDLEKRDMVEISRFCEEAYIWTPAANVLDSITDYDAREKLNEMLVVRFSPDKPVDERKVNDLQNVLIFIKELIAGKKSEWSSCSQKYDDSLIQANLLLSFLNHVEWICDIFANVPGISITIR